MLLSFNPMSLLSLFNLSNLTLLFSTLSSNFNLSYVTHFNYSLSSMDTKNNLTTYSSSKSINTPQDSIYSNLESSSDVRYNKFSNPVVSYDYKCGHYLGIWDKLYPSLMTSYIEVARGMRKAPWMFSDQYSDLLKSNYSRFYTNFTNQLNLKLSDSDNW
jgi:sulfite reductase alpha subunit-like flavoprotein